MNNYSVLQKHGYINVRCIYALVLGNKQPNALRMRGFKSTVCLHNIKLFHRVSNNSQNSEGIPWKVKLGMLWVTMAYLWNHAVGINLLSPEEINVSR